MNPVEDLLSGLLGGLLGQGTPATGPKPTPPATQPATLPATVPATHSGHRHDVGHDRLGLDRLDRLGLGVGVHRHRRHHRHRLRRRHDLGRRLVEQPPATTTTSPGLLGGIIGGLTKTVGGLL